MTEKPQISKRVHDVKKDLRMAYFALGYRSVDVHSPDMPALDVLSAILGQGASSQLNSSLYRKKNLVYSIGSWNYTPQDPGIFVISGVSEPKKLKTALGGIHEVVNNVKRGAIDDDEIERAKTMISTNYIYSLRTLAGQARDLALNEMTTGDPNYLKTYLEGIDSVEKDDLERVAALYLNDDSLFNAFMHPRELERERGVILKEIRLNRDDPVRFISRLLWKTVFTSHPYRHPVIGYEALFNKLTREDLIKYHKRMYVPNNMILVLAGDIEFDGALREIKAYFENRERKAFEDKPRVTEKQAIRRSFFTSCTLFDI